MKTKSQILLSLGGLTLITGLLVAAIDASPTPVPANPPLPSPPSAFGEKLRAQLTEKLHLTADQQAKFDVLMQKQRTELGALRDNKDLSPADRRAKAGAVMEGYRGQVHALLTPEQQKTADEMRGKMQQQRAHAGRQMPGGGHEMGGAPAGHPPVNPMAIIAQGERLKDQMAEKLKLTNEQRDKLDHLGRDFRAKQRQEMKAHLAEMRAVLTPEQQGKVDAWKAHQGQGKGRGPGGRDGMPPPPPMGGEEADDADES